MPSPGGTDSESSGQKTGGAGWGRKSVEREYGYSGWNQQRLEPDSHGMPLEKQPLLKWPSLLQRGRDVSTGALLEEK